MKCYTFELGQLKKGISVVKISHFGGARVKTDEEAVLVGQFVPGINRKFNLAKYIRLDKENPAKIEEVNERDRIIPLAFGQMNQQILFNNEGKKERCVLEAFPKREIKIKDDGTSIMFPVLSHPGIFEKERKNMNIILRVNTFSESAENGKRGDWKAIRYQGYYKKMIVALGRGTTNGVAWKDDIIVMHDKDMIVVSTMGGTPDDEVLIENINGRAIMFPAQTYISEDRYCQKAEDIQNEMIEALKSMPTQEEICFQ